jgi:hypothetical protein
LVILIYLLFVISGKKIHIQFNYYYQSSTSSNAPLLHHLTQEGLGGMPQKSHFSGKPVSASIKNGFSGQDALQIKHPDL